MTCLSLVYEDNAPDPSTADLGGRYFRSLLEMIKPVKHEEMTA